MGRFLIIRMHWIPLMIICIKDVKIQDFLLWVNESSSSSSDSMFSVIPVTASSGNHRHIFTAQHGSKTGRDRNTMPVCSSPCSSLLLDSTATATSLSCCWISNSPTWNWAALRQKMKTRYQTCAFSQTQRRKPAGGQRSEKLVCD